MCQRDTSCRHQGITDLKGHENSAEERVFSMVRKNKTFFRPNLGLDKTLPSLLTVKLATDEPCHKYEPPEPIVKKAGKVSDLGVQQRTSKVLSN